MAAIREIMQGYLRDNDISIKSGTDVNSIMWDMMSVILEGALDEELNEELGYYGYDYRNKDTDTSRNGHSSKVMHTSYDGIYGIQFMSYYHGRRKELDSWDKKMLRVRRDLRGREFASHPLNYVDYV